MDFDSVKTIVGMIPWVAFVLYVAFVMRTIIDIKRKMIDTFIWNPKAEDYKGLIIFEEGDINNGNNILLIKSESNLFNIRIYDGIEPWVDIHNINVDKYNCNQLKEVLTPKEGLMLSFCFAGYAQPCHLLTFENEAFMSAQLLISFKGKDGNKTEAVKYKMTIKSFLYFLLCGIVKYKGE